MGCEGIQATNCTDLTIDGNTISHTQERDLFEESVGLTNVDSSLVINNTLTDVKNIALALNGDQSHHVTFAGNRIVNSGSDAIYISTGAHDCEVYGNVALDCRAGFIVSSEISSLEGDFSVSDINIYSNIAAYCAVAGFGVTPWGVGPEDEEPLKSNISFVNNTSFRNGTGLLISSTTIQDISDDWGCRYLQDNH